MEKIPEDADTVPVVAWKEVQVVVPEVMLGVDERTEVVVEVETPARHPTLTLVASSDLVLVESVLCGQICVDKTPRRARDYSKGFLVIDTVTPDKPLKVVLVNAGSSPATVGATLTARPGDRRWDAA